MVYGQLTAAYPLGVHVDPYCLSPSQFLGVVDTNAQLSSVANDCRIGAYCQSRLLRMTTGGLATLYASNHVYWEVYEHFPRIAKWSKIPAAELRARFEEQYLPFLRYVSVDTSEIDDPQVLAITDLDDVPSGQLAKLIAPCILFSEDKHLRKPGLAPGNWHEAAQFAIDVLEGATEQRVSARTLSLPLEGSVALIKFLGRRTGLSPWLIGTLVVGTGVVILRKPERREAVGKYIIPVLKAYSQQFEGARALEQSGLAGLRETLLAGPAQPTPKQQVAIVLSRQSEPLLAKEIQEQILRHFADESVPTISEVRAVLTDGSEFIQPERYRWQFGRQGGHGVASSLPLQCTVAL